MAEVRSGAATDPVRGTRVRYPQPSPSGVHKGVQALETGIRAWIENCVNQNPRPFTWTKTAEEISTHWQNISRISGAGH